MSLTKATYSMIQGAPVSVIDKGADATGVADSTSAITAAFADVVAGGTVYFPPGIYKVTSAISQAFNNGAVVNIIGYGAKIDGTSVTGSTAGDTTLITIGGARGTGVALGTSAAKYATSIVTGSAISASINDIALITSTDLWNPTRAYYYKGEMIEMQNISGTTITSAAPLFDGYTNSTTTVYPLSMPTVIVEGLEVVMNANQLALVVSYCRNPSIKNVKVHGARYTAVQMQYCFGGTIDSNEIYDAWYSGTGTSYGVAVATCQNVVVSKNNLTEARHCISSGGWEPCRNIIYTNNNCTVHKDEATVNALDTHGNGEFFTLSNNIVNGGISISSIDTVVKDNIIKESRAVAQAVLVFQEVNSNYYEFSGNTITCSSNAIGIYFTPTVASLNTTNLTVHNNIINTVSYCVNLVPRSTSITGCTFGTVSVKNNLMTNTGSSATFYHGLTSGVGFTTTLIDMANNVFKATNYDTVYIQGTVSSTFSSSDKFYGNKNTGYIAQFKGTDTTLLNPYFEGNTGGAGNSRSVDYTSTGTIRCINPVFKNLTFKAELETGVVLYIEQGWYSATPTINNTAGAKLVNFYGTLGRAISYGTAAPTTNTWAVGDRVYNQSPSVGNPKSWVCAVAGTPGTWVSEGNL